MSHPVIYKIGELTRIISAVQKVCSRWPSVAFCLAGRWKSPQPCMIFLIKKKSLRFWSWTTFRPWIRWQGASSHSATTHLCLSHPGFSHFFMIFLQGGHFTQVFPSFFCATFFMLFLQGGQLTPRAVPRLRGGPSWREDADFDTFYLAFRCRICC